MRQFSVSQPAIHSWTKLQSKNEHRKICELGWISTETSISPPSQQRNLTHSFISVVTKPGSSSYKRAHALTACSWTDQVAHLWLTDLPRLATRSVLSESKLKVHFHNAIDELFTKGLAEKIQKIWEHAQIFYEVTLFALLLFYCEVCEGIQKGVA